ncbi:MFS transporter [Dyadobacter flavalbus]|uniref:MFS transporter n=1 Tax=Dyadobacter flavalbus TaxID=2579942 RepID=A0A5M8QUN9_9BACT|nr:MFS transporter [Dyadobacter flavalbus]KAA6438346.1 MFS transporter [Dyadobacter flavalbus]
MKTLTESQKLRYFYFFYLYVMQGIPAGFALIAVTNYLAAKQIDARLLANFGVLVGLPWAFKFVWGPLVDKFQDSGMGRRRPWVLFSQVMAFLASLLLLFFTDPVTEFNVLVSAFVLHGVFASLQDISVDAMAITVVPEPERGRTNALMKSGMVSGQAIGSAGLAVVMHHSGFQTAAVVQSAVLLVLTVLTFFIREKPQHAFLSFRAASSQHTDSSGKQPFFKLAKELVNAILVRRSLFLFCAVAAVFISERLFQRIFTLHLIQKLNWSDTSVSVLSGTYGTMTAVTIALIGGWLSDRIGALRMLFGVTLVMGAGFVCFSLFRASWTHSMVSTSGLLLRQMFESLFSIAALPVLMSVCRRKIAAAQFGFYMALSNQADVLGIYMSGLLFIRFSAPAIGMVCGLAILLATVLIWIAGKMHAES